MKKIKFKTNIKCSGCIAKVTPFLNDEKTIEKWEVDINNPDKILTIESENLDEKSIISVIEKAGFIAEAING
jgi:copper chaperone